MKWGGTVLTVLLLVAWVGSAWWEAAVRCPPTIRAGVQAGVLFMSWETPWSPWPASFECVIGPRPGVSWTWWFDVFRLPLPKGGTVSCIRIPIWFLSLATGLCSAWLWNRDRRRAPGLCCNCGYDLRGNPSSVCPECGA